MYDFTVVITTHRRPLLLSRALHSLRGQTDGNIQIVVVSDISCPETYDVVGQFLTGEDRFVQRSGQPGPAASRNVGMKLIEGEFAVFLDDDDAFTENFFADVKGHLTKDSVLFSDYHVVFERAHEQGYVPTSAEYKPLAARNIDEIHVKNFIPLHCLVYPAEVLRRCTFDPTLKLNEDWDFLLAVVREMPFRHVPITGPMVYSREKADNRGRSNNELLVDTYRRVYRKWPAPRPDIAAARHSFFAANGVEAALADL
jgi:glycosyltransferase involved in cell wall biosynthesis